MMPEALNDIRTIQNAEAERVVLISHVLGNTGRELLSQRSDLYVVEFDNLLTGAPFISLLRQYPHVCGVILGPTSFGRAELDNAPEIKVVSRIGVGIDAIDVAALTERRVPLMVTSIGNAVSVAEHTLFFLLALAKRERDLRSILISNGWSDRLQTLPTELAGKRIAIIGYGRVGLLVARFCNALAMDAVVYDPHVAQQVIATAGFRRATSLLEAASDCDFLTIHCPKLPDNIGLFGASLFAAMKPTAYVINTSRGGLVDEKALYEALSSGRLAGAAIDVFEMEPPPSSHPLLSLPNVIATPHMSGVTVESVERMAQVAVENLLEAIDGRISLENTINFNVLQQEKQ